MEMCRSCGSTNTFEDSTVSQSLNFGGQIVIFENVPARVCRQCGERLFAAEVVRRMEELGKGERPPSRLDNVPVYDVSQVA